MNQGFAVATFFQSDVAVDCDEMFVGQGLFNAIFDDKQTRPLSSQCATIGAWSYGLSRIIDYIIEHENSIDK